MKKSTVVLLTLLILATFTVASAGTKGTWTGWISDDHCGAKGAKAEHKDCAVKCLGNGGKLVFYNPADEKIYSLDKQDVAEKHLGHEVKVTGELNGSAIKVESIAMAAE